MKRLAIGISAAALSVVFVAGTAAPAAAGNSWSASATSVSR